MREGGMEGGRDGRREGGNRQVWYVLCPVG